MSEPDNDTGGMGRYASLFAPVFGAPAVEAALSPAAWVQAMLDVEAALARALADTGQIPAADAETIAAHCRAELLDPAAIGEGATGAGNPAVPLVRALTAAVPGDAAKYVHRGATSQDITDTATMLLARRALAPVFTDLAAVTDGCAALAEAHRDTVLAGRTLSQHAVPTTFGVKAAGWLHGVDAATDRLRNLTEHLPAQLGGAAGTLAALGAGPAGDPAGPAVLAAFARRLDLTEPVLPWHTLRAPITELATTAGVLVGALGKIAQDVVLLAQTDVGELAEPAGGGGSSTMPHKQNPIRSITVLANARRAPGLVATVLGAMVAEHERPAGAWHAEWEPVRDLLRLTGGAAHQLATVVPGLRVDRERMRANLDRTGGLLLAEHVTAVLTPALGRLAAHDLVSAACRTAVADGRPLRDVLGADDTVTRHLAPAELDAALDPAHYLGAARVFTDRALADYQADYRGPGAP